MTTDVCACGHERAWHGPESLGGGTPCSYGHGAATGGCSCDSYHARRRGSRTRSARPAGGDLLTRFLQLRTQVNALFDAFEADLATCAISQIGLASVSAQASPLDGIDGRVVLATAEEPSRATLLGDLSDYERALLQVLADRRFEPTTSLLQLAVLSGYSAKSSAFHGAIRSLRDRGLVDERRLQPTPEGLDPRFVDLSELPPKGEALFNLWSSKLDGYPRALLSAIASTPGAISRERIAERTGYSLRSSSFDAGLRRLRELGLVEQLEPHDYQLARELR